MFVRLQPTQQRALRTAPRVVQQHDPANVVQEIRYHMSQQPRAKEGNQRTAPSHPQSLSASNYSRGEPHATAGSSHLSSASSSTARPRRTSLQPIVKAEPGLSPESSILHSSRTGRRGGRQKYSHLPEQARQKSHKMRKVAACWRCAMQRDSVRSFGTV